MTIIGGQGGGGNGTPSAIATSDKPGIVKPGDGLAVTTDGTLFIDTEGFDPESLINATWSI
ncbi:hypothetical protein RGI97_002818 [Serratia marcescens]